MIDLRSDTVTRPTEGMRRAMSEAPLGDDVFGEDPTINRLEEYVADLSARRQPVRAVWHDDQPDRGVRQHRPRRRGAPARGRPRLHLRGGAPALLSSVQVRTLPGERGVISPETLRGAVRPEDVHFPRSRLLCLENTHNTAGGRIYALEDFAAVAAEAKDLGLKVHLDGARLFNAQAATGTPAREWCEHADTVSVCSSKGLGAPVGSLLAGDAQTIGEARRARKAFGGGMRQAGVIAAGSLYAFEHHVDRLAEDHERAKKLADGLHDAGYDVQPPRPTSFSSRSAPDRFLEALAREGVLATPMTGGTVRFCTHLDVGDAGIEAAIEAASRITSDTLQR